MKFINKAPGVRISVVDLMIAKKLNEEALWLRQERLENCFIDHYQG